MSTSIVPGSLSAISQQNNTSLAESFMQSDCVLLLDESGSMSSTDAKDGKSRRQVAREEVIRLQKDFPGKVALIAFSDYPVFCPAGIPTTLDGSTNLLKALEYIKCVDGTGMKIILVCDGTPGNQEGCIKFASQFESKIDCVFIGPESDIEGGRKFLERLAKATGGKYIDGKPELIQSRVETLLLEKGK